MLESDGLLRQPPMMLLRRRAPQTIPPRVWTSVLWHANPADPLGAGQEAVQAHFLPPATGIYTATSRITAGEPEAGRLLIDVCVVGDGEPMPAVRSLYSPDRGREVDLDSDGQPIPWFTTLTISGAMVLDAARFETCDVRLFVDGPDAVLLPPNPSDFLAVEWNANPD